MNLPSKIAGTLALPLALAIASTSHAATIIDTDKHQLRIGGYVSAISSWVQPDDAKGTEMHHNLGLGNSRFNVGYTNKELGVSFTYEQLLAVPGSDDYLRHAYLSTTDGWVAGWTWSFGANLTAAGETIDVGGPERAMFGHGGGALSRNGVLGKNFKLADNMSVGVAIEDKWDGPGLGEGRDAVENTLPDVVVNFRGNFSGTQVFAAVTHYTMNVATKLNNDGDPVPDTGANADDESFIRATAGLNLPLGDALNFKAGATLDDKDIYVTAAAGIKLTDKIRANLVVEQSELDGESRSNAKSNAEFSQTSIWVNAFYKADNGIEWGAEVQSVSGEKHDKKSPLFAGHLRSGYATSGGRTVMTDGGLAVLLQAKYAF